MATQQATVDFILDQLRDIPSVSARKMFGEYALYCQDKVVALICDDHLFVKISPISSQFLDSSYEAPAYPGAKNSLQVPEDKWEDSEWLTQFITQTAETLPLPVKKHKKTAQPRTKLG